MYLLYVLDSGYKNIPDIRAPTSIENCYRKAGFPIMADNCDVDEIFDATEFGGVMQKEEFVAFVDCDKEAVCFGTVTDAEICDLLNIMHIMRSKI